MISCHEECSRQGSSWNRSAGYMSSSENGHCYIEIDACVVLQAAYVGGDYNGSSRALLHLNHPATGMKSQRIQNTTDLQNAQAKGKAFAYASEKVRTRTHRVMKPWCTFGCLY
eukprot:gene18405-biopygen5395